MTGVTRRGAIGRHPPRSGRVSPAAGAHQRALRHRLRRRVAPRGGAAPARSPGGAGALLVQRVLPAPALRRARARRARGGDRPRHHQRDLLLPRGVPAPRLQGRDPPRAARRARTRASGSACGAPAAPPARRCTPSPCSPASRGTSPGAPCASSGATSRAAAWPTRGAACTGRRRSARCPPICGAATSPSGPTGRTSPTISGASASSGTSTCSTSPRSSVVGRVDVIFCRNVLIYFDDVSRRRVIEMFYERLLPGGYLLLGHSESLLNVSTAFELVHLREDSRLPQARQLHPLLVLGRLLPPRERHPERRARHHRARGVVSPSPHRPRRGGSLRRGAELRPSGIDGGLPPNPRSSMGASPPNPRHSLPRIEGLRPRTPGHRRGFAPERPASEVDDPASSTASCRARPPQPSAFGAASPPKAPRGGSR